MHKDAKDREIIEASIVRILHPDEQWFSYLSADEYAILQAACKGPLKVAYLDDDETISLELPPTLEPDGDYISNSITLNSNEVLLVESDC
jgi:hypothetical protein